MRLGKAAAYGVLAVVHIAEHEKEVPIQGRDIAEACNMPPGHLLKILQQLVRTQILVSERGPAGGFALRRPAKSITLLEILEAIDGPVTADIRVSQSTRGKERAKNNLEATCEKIAKYTRTVFGDVTVRELMG